MKKLLLVALASVLLPSAVQAEDGVVWHDDLPKAMAEARETGKPVLALFWAEW